MFKTTYSLFLIAEYFVFQAEVSGSFGSFWHANVNRVWISNFQPLRSTNLAIVGAKFVFLDFLEFKAFQAEKTTSHFIST